MAQVAEIETVEPKNQPVQNAESTDTVKPSGNEAQRKRPNLPPVIGGAYTIPFADACDYTAKLNERDWAHVEGYVFRLYPRILRLPPLDKNIGFINKPITKEWMLSNFGSGKYQIKLNDTNRGDKKGIFESFIEFDEAEFPPQYDIRELDIRHRDNRQLVEHLKRTGKLTADGEVITPAKPENADASMADALKSIALEAMRGRQEKPGLEGQAFSKMMDMMSNASAKSIDIALAQLKGNEKAAGDPMMTLVMQFMMKQLELAEKRAEPAKSNGTDPMMTLMLKQIELAEKRAELAETRAIEERKTAEAERQRQHEKDMELLKQRATAADPMDMVEKVLNLKERLGGEEPDGRNWKEKLVDQGFEALPSILNAVQGYVARRPGVQPQPQQPQPQQPRPMQPQPQPAQTAQPAAPIPGVDTVQPQPITDPEIAFLLPLFEAQGRQLVRAFSSDPGSGPDVARMVSLLAGAAAYERIARMGREKILLAIAMLPEMQADLLKAGTPEMLAEFIDDFIAGPEDPDEDEDEDEGEDDPADPDEFPKMGQAKRKGKVAKVVAQ